MFQIPIDRHGKSRSLSLRSIYSNEPPKVRTFQFSDLKSRENSEKNLTTETKGNNEVKEKLYFKPYTSLIPKMSLTTEKVSEKNPRILDLREKLNEISRKQDCNVDKVTKGLINDITQHLVDDKEGDESGPYSLLFDLQTNPSTSSNQLRTDSWNSKGLEESVESNSQSFNRVTSLPNKSMERLPNVVNFDDKPLKEFEYSCEKEFNYLPKKPFCTQSRSDLCLQLKSHIHSRTYETNLSPNDNSLTKNNEENSLDDSLGILTPDQMDDICYLENAFSPTVEGLPIFCDNNDYKTSSDNGDTPSTDKTDSNSAASTIQNDGFENIGNRCNKLKDSFAPIATIDAIDPIINEDSNFKAFCFSIEESLEQEKKSLKDDANLSKEDISNLVEEEFLPSIHGSILEPASSVADTTVNLEIPLDCKHGNQLGSNRIDQTPSPEDLPLDSSDLNGEISTYSQFSASTLHDSQTYSDSKNDKSMETSKVSNSFITSITSITSLDGYQGDGEMSRPVSRSADHNVGPREDVNEMDWQNVPVPRRVDPMTDSDFFTESDADGLEEHMQRGDRKAQVIDGALYGGKNMKGNAPLIVNRSEDSCMESSGVYTDFENQRASPVFLNVINDMSPDSTTSTHSECSQKSSGCGKINKNCFTPIEDALEEQNSDISHVIDDEETPKNTSKRNSLNSVKDARCVEKGKEEKRSFTLKKYKMPKRDVPSKLKTMLASRKTEVNNSVQNSPKAVKKPDRRENFLKKNSMDIKTDYKTKSFKDIKSKVDCTFTLQRSQTSCSVTRMLSSKSTNTNTKPKR